MIYKFPQFNVEISNPTISVDLNTIQDRAIDKILKVGFTLVTDSASFGMSPEDVDMPYTDTWEDSEVEGMVVEWLTQFIV